MPMDAAERYKREQDLVFQEIEEMERLERQAKAADEEAKKRGGSWFHDEVTRRFMRKKYFRLMSKEQQQEFVENSIREYWRRTSTDSGAQI